MGSLSLCLRRPSAVWWLVGINAAVFVALTAFSYAFPNAASYLAMPGIAEEWAQRPWTAFTYMFAQTGFIHLFFNMLMLLWFGTLLQDVIRQWSFAALYVGGGFLGALFFLGFSHFLSNGASDLLLGSSAAVLAVMTAAGLMMGDYTVHLFFVGDVRLKWIALVMAVLSFLNLGGGGIEGAAAHLGGIVFGIGWAANARKNVRRKTGVKKRKPKAPTKAGVRKVVSILEQNRMDKIRMDELLDKIRVSGYGSLSRKERAELDEISRRISK